MIKAIFFDLSGVLYAGDTAIEGAVAAIQSVQSSAVQARFVTNTSRLTRATLLRQLQGLGFNIQAEQLYSAPTAAKAWIQQQGKRPYCLVHEDLKAEFSDLDQSDPNAVIIGDAADGFNYSNLNRAFQLCLQGAPLIGIGRNRFFKLNDEFLLDAGPFIAAIEYAASTKAVIMGKPSVEFFNQVLKTVNCQAHEVLMIGDDVYGDVEAALNAGLQACLVKTGKYQAGDEQLISGAFGVYPSITQVIDAVLTSNGLFH